MPNTQRFSFSSLDYIPKTKSRQKNKSSMGRSIRYKFLRAKPQTDKFYIGDVWFGKTNNILPEEWLSGEAEFHNVDDDDRLVLHFGLTVVVITITTDVHFVKDLLNVRLFSINLKLDEENVIASLYLKNIPLPKFSNKIGSVLKTIFSLTHNVCCEYNEINSIKSSCTIENFNDLYKNIAALKKKVPDKPINHCQLKPILRPYQQQAVKWMLYREGLLRDHELLHPLYQKVTLSDGVDIYFDKYTGYIMLEPPLAKYFESCGILADEMGLGKTVEVLALILLNKRPKSNIVPELPISDVNATNEPSPSKLAEESISSESSSMISEHLGSSPSVHLLSRKRKVRHDDPDSKDTHVIEEKKVKKQEKAKKSALRQALESWYEMMLDNNKRKDFGPIVQCVCGDTNENDVVECSKCGKMQHATCLGYNRKYGAYICPQCWIEQPLLESDATLIVTPMSLKQQWCDEICKHVSGNFKVLQYKSGKDVKCIYPMELQEYDVVITTYSTLQSELRLSENGQSVTLRQPQKYSLPGSPITVVHWWRLCLDEAQTVETPGNMVSMMAKKLSAQYRWAVTGTPISKDISDLYGLIDYLQITPYCELETWENILYKPYINGRKTNMHNFLTEVMWRTSKNDVLNQINIPLQTVKEHWLEFTAVEKFFYEREHELISREFLRKLRNVDLALPLNLVNKRVLKKIMDPLLVLRQACVHHQTAKGRYLATRKQVSSMGDLLDALISKSFAQCEESLRTIVSAMNGLASIFLLQNSPKDAAETYRKVLTLARQYAEKEKEIVLEVDKLQLIHVTYNLMEILEHHKAIPQSVEDDQLEEKWNALEEGYLNRFTKPVTTTLNDNEKLSGQITELQKKFVLSPGQWFADALDWVTINQHFKEYLKKLWNLCGNAQVKLGFNYTSERSVMYKISTWDERLTSTKIAAVTSIEALLTFDENEDSCSVPAIIIRQAADCHLRPEKKSKNKKGKALRGQCRVCLANIRLKEYESMLFSSELQDNDNANTGSWKPAPEEMLLRALLSIAKSYKANQDVLHDGTIHLEILELLKKEFKEIRKLWTLIDALICAKDELDMCKIRLQIKEPKGEENKQNRLLKALDYEIKNRMEDIYYLEATEIPYQLAHLSSQERCGTKMLEENMGTYKYLQTLYKQQMKGEDPDPCPICKCVLEKQWNIITCGHCYCLECMQVLIGQQMGCAKRQYVTCAICRKSVRVSDISYIYKDEEKTDTNGFQIEGNSSSKVEAVVRLILELKADDDKVKVLVFSNWTLLLKLMQHVFSLNNISSEVLIHSQFEKSLDNFKDANKGITALLLPVNLGGKGLNLIEATHIIFVEPLLNPGEELQAIGRVHRIGQTRPTVVHKFFIRNTIEESIYHTMSSNTEEWDANRVTLGHFKQLFDYTSFNGASENMETQDVEDVSTIEMSDTNISATSLETSVNHLNSAASTTSTSMEAAVILALNAEIVNEVHTMEEAEVIALDVDRSTSCNSQNKSDNADTSFAISVGAVNSIEDVECISLSCINYDETSQTSSLDVQCGNCHDTATEKKMELNSSIPVNNSGIDNSRPSPSRIITLNHSDVKLSTASFSNLTVGSVSSNIELSTALGTATIATEDLIDIEEKSESIGIFEEDVSTNLNGLTSFVFDSDEDDDKFIELSSPVETIDINNLSTVIEESLTDDNTVNNMSRWMEENKKI